MVVVVKDYVWKQTAECVVVTVPLRGIAPSKVDVFTTDIYIKANYYPYFFEAFLLHAIEESQSSCTVASEEIVFNLRKSQSGVFWDALCVQLNRDEKRVLREKISEAAVQKAVADKKMKQEMLHELQRKAVQQQIDMESNELKKIDEIRNTERDSAMQDLESWKLSHTEHLPGHLESKSFNDCAEEGLSTASVSEESADDDVWASEEGCSSEIVQRLGSVQLTADDMLPVPLPRKSGSISVSFTPRAFPTPCRESREPKEQAWLKKQAEARRATGFVAEDLRPEECDPQWLKDKGDSFYQVGNYLGAISAYSHGIKLSSKMAALYVNRSAAHFALGNLQRAVEDCSTALELMVPRVKLNEESRARCHARRGAALCQLGMLLPGLADLEEAFKLQPGDKNLEADIQSIRARLSASSSSSEDD